MMGKVYLSVVDFYDIALQAMRTKTRPVLIVGGPHENDYTVLPISTITNRINLNSYYDIPIPPQDRAVLNLRRECFVRTHRQMPIHAAALVKELGDMKSDAPALYLDAVAKMEEFQKEIVTYAI